MGRNVFHMLKDQHFDVKDYRNTDEKGKEEIVQMVFDTIRKFDGFPYPYMTETEKMMEFKNCVKNKASQWYDKKTGEIKKSNLGLTMVNTFFPNIFEATKPRVVSIYDAFFDDKILKKSIHMAFKSFQRWDFHYILFNAIKLNNKVGYTSNFKPMVAKTIYDIDVPVMGKVFDYSCGYGGRLFGAMTSNKVQHYVGTDPNTETFKNLNTMYDWCKRLIPKKEATLYNIPSEQFPFEKYQKYFDLAFSSPPYFNLEIYTDEGTQSYNKYDEYDAWIKHYFIPTIKGSSSMVRDDGLFAINVAPVNHVKQDLRKDAMKICHDLGLEHVKTNKMALSVRPGTGTGKGTVGKKYEFIEYFRRV